MVGEYVTNCCLYSAHKLCQITWHSGLLAQLEQHIIMGICCLSHRYTVQDGHGTTEYTIFDLFHGLDFGWQAFVGLGAKLTKEGASPQIIILKVYCQERACWFREEDILQEIHKAGDLPGVPRIFCVVNTSYTGSCMTRKTHFYYFKCLHTKTRIFNTNVNFVMKNFI